MTYDVFISYSRKDTAVADRICEAFDRAGINYFIDRQGIVGGMEFPKILAPAIKDSEVFLLLASENAYQSPFTTREILYAFNKKRGEKMLPYIIDGSVLPDDVEFVFSATTWRTMHEHPIETVLVDDVLRLLGRARAEQPKPAPKPTMSTTDKRVFNVGGVEFTMVYVEGGTFTMGATAEQGDDAFNFEKPAHKVTLDSFHIGQTVVTQSLWNAVMGNNPSRWKGDNLPVECVSWDDTQEFILKLNRMTGQAFRLPTEEEWEFAARGGNKSRGYKYSGGDNLDSVAWYRDNSGDKTHPVVQKLANELGLYDMSGNVWEWCSSVWCSDYNSARSGSYRVYRGGSWNTHARFCRVSYRGIRDPSIRNNHLGFRLALSR